MAERRLEERCKPALDGVRIGLHRRSRARDVDTLLAESRRGGAGELERVRLVRHRVVPIRLDPRHER